MCIGVSSKILEGHIIYEIYKYRFSIRSFMIYVLVFMGVGKVNCIVYKPPLEMLNAVYTPICIVYAVYTPLNNIVCCIPIFSCVYSDFAINIVTIGLGKVLKQP